MLPLFTSLLSILIRKGMRVGGIGCCVGNFEKIKKNLFHFFVFENENVIIDVNR